MIYVLNTSLDPTYNLALEEFLVTTKDSLFAENDIAMLWQDEPTVVVGRNQNTERELDRVYLEQNDIHAVRRMSGGGAVYHDLGNVNFTIIKRNAHALKNNFSFFTDPLVETLRLLGAKAEFSGRNDVLVEGAKFSGNAQYSHGDTLLHHGTILFDSDLSVLGHVLKPKQRDAAVEAKGVASHKSRVANLREYLDVTLEEFVDIFAHRLAEIDIAAPLNAIELDEGQHDEVLALREGKYRTLQWNWGASPHYTHMKEARFDAGNVLACMNVDCGIVTTFDIYGDFFEVKPLDLLQKHLSGCAYSDLRNLILNTPVEEYIHNLKREELAGLV
ncbi:MAG: lipoate--protein ligase [Coriobacteriia bacterium]|nr:lipoate--protein ligase [Coriobacteriia bacterium]